MEVIAKFLWLGSRKQPDYVMGNVSRGMVLLPLGEGLDDNF